MRACDQLLVTKLLKIHSNEKIAILHYTSNLKDVFHELGANPIKQKVPVTRFLGILGNFCFKGLDQKCL